MVDRRRRILRQHVQTDRLLGVEVVPRATRAKPVDSAAAVDAPDAEPAEPPADPAESPTRPVEAPTDAAAPMAMEEREPALRVLDEQQVRGCTACELCQGRTQTVFGEGSARARIMFVGEGPGYDEDQSGRPFVGQAGQLLEKMIKAMGHSRQSVYIANLVKCRPPGNRTPTAGEIATCWGYLHRQIEIIRPEVIVTLGGPASKRLLDVETGITRLRGSWHTCRAVSPPVPVMPTFHPSYVQRTYTKDTRGKVWADLRQVLEYLERLDGS